jgi:hypothetical protein
MSLQELIDFSNRIRCIIGLLTTAMTKGVPKIKDSESEYKQQKKLL